MANYVVSRYCTGIRNTADEASSALEEHLEYLDSTNHPMIKMGVVLTERDRQQAIGWLLHQGWDVMHVMEATHSLVDDGPFAISPSFVLEARHLLVDDGPLTITTS